MTTAGVTALSYDARGNLTASGASAYGYTSENLLITGPASATLSYDPAMRLYQSVGAGVTTRFGYDGVDLIAEYNASNALLRRYVHGPGTDEPLVWYEGSTLTDRRFLHADERGSVIALSDGTGAVTTINKYDEYGIPSPTNAGRFAYTGQTWLPELGLYYYKARIYSPTLGRFMQTDPIGYGDGVNWYDYVGGDPVNERDPSGLADEENEIVVRGRREPLRSRDVTPIKAVPSALNPLPYSIYADADPGANDCVEGSPDGTCTIVARAPKKLDVKPEFCKNRIYIVLGKPFVDVGGIVADGGLVAASAGAVTGIGVAPGLVIAGSGAAIQSFGVAAQFLAGDRKAIGRYLLSRVGTKAVKNLVPKALRNRLADAATDAGFGKLADYAIVDPCK